MLKKWMRIIRIDRNRIIGTTKSLNKTMFNKGIMVQYYEDMARNRIELIRQLSRYVKIL